MGVGVADVVASGGRELGGVFRAPGGVREEARPWGRLGPCWMSGEETVVVWEEAAEHAS